VSSICVVITTKKKVGILEDSESKPLSKAQWIVGDAANGSKSICGKFGKVVMRLRTDVQGNFKLNRLPPGEYWVTYVDPQDGESFLIRLDKGRRSGGRLELQIDQRKGLCYLVDIERNATKPPTTWPKPRPEMSDAQTN